MANRRKKAIEGAGREGNTKGLARYRYVDLEQLERLGIEQYKPEDGQNYIAIIPPNDEAHQDDEFLSMFCREIRVHTYIGVDNSTFLCMKEMREHVANPDSDIKEKWNLDCPVCEMAQQLRQTNPDSELIKDLRPQTRYLFFVVDVSSLKKNATTEKMEASDLKVMYWDAAGGVRTRIVNASSDPRSGEAEYDVADPDDGRTIIFKRTGKVYKCEDFKTEERNPIPLDWLDQIPVEFDDILKIPVEADVRAEVEGIPAAAGDEPAGGRRGGGRRRRSDKDQESDDKSEGNRGRRQRDGDDGPETEEKPKNRRRRGDDDTETEEKPKSRRRRGDDTKTEEKPKDRRGRRSDPKPDDSEPDDNEQTDDSESEADDNEQTDDTRKGESKIDQIRAKIAKRKAAEKKGKGGK